MGKDQPAAVRLERQPGMANSRHRGEFSVATHDVPISANQAGLAQLNERSREIFRQVVESYLATGEPVGSRNL